MNKLKHLFYFDLNTLQIRENQKQNYLKVSETLNSAFVTKVLFFKRFVLSKVKECKKLY